MAVTMRTTDESDDVQNATKAKCIVPRSKDAKGNVMAAYVNKSADLLRKVRHGHSLGSVLAKSRSQATQRKSKTGIVDAELTDLSREIAVKLPPSARTVLRSRYAQSPSAQSLIPREAIRFGRKVRFRAADGGFLLIEDTGCMRKAPSEMQHDPRTCITLFPRDPITRVGPDKWVRSGDRLCLAQNASSHGAVQGNSSQPHAKRNIALEYESRASPYPRKDNQAKVFHCSHQSQELTTSITWHLRQSKRSIQHHDNSNGVYFNSGASVKISQDNMVLWCELQFPMENKRRYTAPSVTSFSSSTPVSTESACEGSLTSSVPIAMNSMSISTVSGVPGASMTSKFSRVWLDSEHATSSANLRNKGGSSEANQTHWSNDWTIVCVDEKQSPELNPKACYCALREAAVIDLCSRDEAHKANGNHQGSVSHLRSVAAREHHAALVIGRFLSHATRCASSRRLQSTTSSHSLKHDAFVSRKMSDAKAKLTTPEQLMVLQHYNPRIYGSVRSFDSVNQRIPGVSLVGNVSVQREQRALARMRNEVTLLSGDWQQPHQSPLPKNYPKLLERPRSATVQTILTNREKELQFYVQMKMTRRAEPRLQFGSPSRLPKAVSSDKAMSLSARSVVSPLKREQKG